MKKLALLLASLALALLVAGCGGAQGSAADAPTDFKVVAGDGSVRLTWTPQPDVEYWLFYGPGSDITTTNWVGRGGRAIPSAVTPAVISGLTNGVTYSFTINGRKDGGPGGPGAPTLEAVPKLAGTDWAPDAPLGSGTLNGVTTGTTTAGFSIVSVGSGGAIYASIAGGAATTPVNPAAPADLNAVCYGAYGLVAAGAGGTLLLSLDSTTWTAQTSGTTATLLGVSPVGTAGYIATGAGGTLLTSGNGSTWNIGTSGTPMDLYSAAFGASLYVAVGAGGTILTSADAATWTPVASGTTSDLRSVTYATLATTNADSSITLTNTFVAVGAAGTVLTSNDGLAWTVQSPLSPKNLNAVTYGGQFVAVGAGGVIFTSTDGITWVARNSGTTNDLNAVARTQLGYTAVGAQGTSVSTI
ncbi:MAG: fibronectin type III domain-containing protein [Betaproteobacteria bacterium]|nr:fibronectin type III domain-containing protein [Betaproteobacteria bacterium]